jgi:hypothetical protein
VIPALEAAQAFTAGFKQLPAIAARSSQELTPTGSHYDRVFNKELQPEEKLFLYPFLLRQWARKNGYSHGGDGWKAHSTWFFIYTYFFIVMEMLRKLKWIDTLEVSPLLVSTEYFDVVFYSEKLNAHLLQITDDVLSGYFIDSKVDEAIGQDLRRFLRSQESIERFKPIMLRHIDAVLKRSDCLQVLDTLLSQHTT